MTAPSGQGWSGPRPAVAVGLGLAAVILTVAYARRPGDFAGYLLVGELALQGRHIYTDAPPGVSTWPPFFSLLCVPLALLARLSLPAARVTWLALNFLALGAVIALVHRLVARGPDTRGSAAPAALSSVASLVLLALTSRYVLSNFEHLQINVLIFLLSLGGLALAARGREPLGGLALGAAIALKVMPGLFVPYLAWKRRWRAAAWTALWAMALTALPAAVYGWTRFVDYLGAWRDALRAGWGVGRMNQSVYAMLDRAVGHGLVPFAAPGVNDLAASGSPIVRAVWLASFAVSLALVARAARAPDEATGRGELAEWSAVFLIASLFGTVAWKAYLVVLLPANALLLHVWRDPSQDEVTRRGARGAIIAAFLVGVLTTDGLWGREIGNRLEMGSVVTWAGLVMLGGILWVRGRLGWAWRKPAGGDIVG